METFPGIGEVSFISVVHNILFNFNQGEHTSLLFKIIFWFIYFELLFT